MDLLELLFRRTEAQSNIFSSATIPNFDISEDAPCEVPFVDSLLVACLKPVPPGDADRQRIMIHSCLTDTNSIRAVSKPLLSNSLSPDSEVVAIDAKVCSVDGDEPHLILAFAFIKRKIEPSLCIHRLRYSEMQELSRHQGKVLLPMETATIMPLSHLPWQVTSVKFCENGELKLALLVVYVRPPKPSSDFRPLSVFTLRANGDYVMLVNYENFFPEFRTCDTQIFFLESVFLEEKMERLTAWGTDKGGIFLSSVNEANEILVQQAFSHSTPITALRLFPDFDLPRCPPASQGPGAEAAQDHLSLSAEAPVMHLLVASAAEPTVVYRDPLRRGLSLTNQVILPDSADYDSVLCVGLFDRDLDGIDEIVLGTYSGHLLIYKEDRNDPIPEYRIVGRQKMGGPVLGLHVADMTGDGVKELAVVTTRGVHVMQYPLHFVIDRLAEAVASDS